ncbi:hypothetical protein [Streptomonospora wellingtoniae]|uniref:Uncharacterized protein n=1 Tax=Streptomonospora wellingtoniae TaxID=3075544 RepID=A0ABU2L082_9ACTN|nr:hypothetical protein [Streptomonospora sp. DSM 45055]MDT0304826.1 hypothetical protein [Streptomonospora sp. DSM 45055]
MSNPSIASKLMSMVKGVFGQKEQAAAPSPASASAEPKAEAGAAESTAAPAGATKTAAPADEKAAGAGAESGADEAADLVAPGEEVGVAEELAAAEATTQESDDSVLEDVRRQAAPAADELPVPGYDGLTLPSIRARLRKLTIEQVRELRAYEVANGERAEFIKMYDNRIAKLQSEGQE